MSQIIDIVTHSKQDKKDSKNLKYNEADLGVKACGQLSIHLDKLMINLVTSKTVSFVNGRLLRLYEIFLPDIKRMPHLIR